MNSLWVWRRDVSLPRVARNFLVIYVCRYLPSPDLEERVLPPVRGTNGRHVAAGLSATLDIFYPELISIGDNTILGYDSIIMTHEFLRTELRMGPVVIGRDVVIGANCTILPGVVIGDGAMVAAHSLVNQTWRRVRWWGECRPGRSPEPRPCRGGARRMLESVRKPGR